MTTSYAGSPPSQTTPLLTFHNNISEYASIKAAKSRPKLSLIIPPNRSPRPILVTNIQDHVAIDIDRLQHHLEVGSYTSCHHSTSATNRSSVRIAYCNYCNMNRLRHDSMADYRGLWTRMTESEGVLAVLEFLIATQMRLLSFLTPMLLLFVLGLYIMAR